MKPFNEAVEASGKKVNSHPQAIDGEPRSVLLDFAAKREVVNFVFLDFAAKREVDYVVIGSRGLGAVKKLIM